jgi:hypothetical protein
MSASYEPVATTKRKRRRRGYKPRTLKALVEPRTQDELAYMKIVQPLHNPAAENGVLLTLNIVLPGDLPVQFDRSFKKMGKSELKYKKYKIATTLAQARDMGATGQDVQWDLVRGNMRLPVNAAASEEDGDDYSGMSRSETETEEPLQEQPGRWSLLEDVPAEPEVYKRRSGLEQQPGRSPQIDAAALDTQAIQSIRYREEWVIAIPSYNRVNHIVKQTLGMLFRYGIDPGRIYVFVNFDEQKEEYQSRMPSVHVVATHQKKSIKNVRNFIVDYFAPDQKFVSLDDDITHIYAKQDGNKLKDVPDLARLIDYGFALCKHYGFTLWGIYPSPNPLSMNTRGDYTTDLRFIVGSFMGIINKRRHVHIDWKEDYELSLLANRLDGGLIRFNKICVKHTIGGVNGIDTSKEARIPHYTAAAKWLMRTYDPEGKLIRWNKKRPGEILFTTKLNRRPHTKKAASNGFSSFSRTERANYDSDSDEDFALPDEPTRF